MSNASDFVIENGVLKKYNGSGGDVIIPEGVTSIGYQAFRDCKSLTSIMLPEGVTSIGDSAFSWCSSLTSITLPEGVTSIGKGAFWCCRSLTSVVIPEGVTSIENGAFWGCKGLAADQGFVIVRGVLYYYCGDATSVVIPEGVTSIGSSAFDGCRSLTSVVIPDGVTSIRNSAFSKCSNLTSVAIPDSVTSIGDWTFKWCSSLTSITLPEGVTSIGDYAFDGCSSLTSITLPEGLTSIGGSAFRGCSSLTSITLPEGLTSIVDSAFYGCSRLTSITLQEGVRSIGSSAFGGCKSLTSITLPEGVTSIGSNAFDGCSSLTSVVIPDGVTSIGRGAFRVCSSLTSVVIPDGVTSIGRGAFYGCSSLTSVVIPDSVTSIGDWAFRGCKGLKETNGFVIVRGVLYDYDGPGGDVVIPEGVTSIGKEAFENCSSLTSVVIPDSVTSIGNWAFDGCSSLTSVVITEGVTSIGESAFEDCSSLTSIKLPESLTIIEEKAFKSCDSLNAIELPKGKDISWLAVIDKKGQLIDCFSNMPDLCRNADEAEMAKMITQSKKWPSKWKKLFFASYLHSDTRAAMMLADKRGEFSQYASLHNADEDELRDRMLSDLGLNEQHCKLYDLGNQTVTARLLPDFKFALERSDGKTIRSLPKKGADPEKYDAAKKDFAQMKKDAVKIWKNRADVLLRDFLSGKERTAEYWSRTYGGNPILHGVACLLVWEQDGQYFTRTDAGTIHADGTPYELTEEPVRLAHPMEMKPEEVDRWQHYFTSRGLKQPFEQIWEPVEQADLVKPGRYDDCTIPLYMLMNKEKHGIIMEGQGKITLRDCTAELVYIEGHHDWINNEFEVRNFRFKKYTRQVNHIVVHLDKGTVAGRIKKDDITAARWFDRFTLAQITEFIKTAQEANAVNVLAELLEYKNAHFADFDPMEEFTLEW